MRPDSRITDLARNLIGYSLKLQPGELLYIDLIGADTHPLGAELVRLATERGAIPFWNDFDDHLAKPFFERASEEQHRAFAAFHKAIMERADAYVGVRGTANPFEQGDLSAEQKKLKQRHYMEEVHLRTRLRKRWCVLRWPNAAMALMARKSVAAFEDFYFRVCNLDYGAMSRAMDPLVELLRRADRVRLAGPGTELEFSIRGLPAIKCDGAVNIPDGEVFTAPVRDSIERRHHLQHHQRLPGGLLPERPVRVQGRPDRPGHGAGEPAGAGRDPRLGRGGSLRRRVRRRREPLRPRPDERHPLRREDPRAPSTSRPATPTRSATTATSRACTGTWCSSSARSTAAASSGSTARWSARTAASCCRRWPRSTPTSAGERRGGSAASATWALQGGGPAPGAGEGRSPSSLGAAQAATPLSE